MFNERVRLVLGRSAAIVMAVASIGSVSQIIGRAVLCKELICQLHYATIYSRVHGVPLALIVVLETAALMIMLAVLSAKPRWFNSVGRLGISIVCLSAFLLSLRIALIETILLRAWSPLCVAASWLCLLILAAGIAAVIAGHPRTRAQGGVAVLTTIVVATLSLYLMQEGGLPEIRTQKADLHLLFSPHSHSLGPESAKLQIVEFADFRCPPCQREAPELRTLVEKYHGSIRLVQRELPNERIHPQAERAAEIAECFGEQGEFWSAATELYRVAAIPDDTGLEGWVTRFGVSGPQFRACMAQHRTRSSIVKDREDAHALGVAGTPTLFIGDKVLEGATSMDKLDRLLHSQMTTESRQSMPPLGLHLLPSSGCSVDGPNEKQQTKGADAPCS
jgi:protein-disulfide isomerase